ENASWKPPQVLPFFGDVREKVVCTTATDYGKWPSGMILYEGFQKDNQTERALEQLGDAYEILLKAIRAIRNEQRRPTKPTQSLQQQLSRFMDESAFQRDGRAGSCKDALPTGTEKASFIAGWYLSCSWKMQVAI